MRRSRSTIPALTTRDVFLDANGEADPFKSRYTGLAIGVPGTVAGLELAWRKYGSGKLSFADLVAPAAQLAHKGLTVDDDVADSLPLGQKQLALHPSAARIYLGPDLSPRVAGDHIALDESRGDARPRAAAIGRPLDSLPRFFPRFVIFQGVIGRKISAPFPRACPHLSQASAQTSCNPARKLRAVFS